MVKPSSIEEALEVIPDETVLEDILNTCFPRTATHRLIQQFELENHIDNGLTQTNRVSDVPLSQARRHDEWQSNSGKKTRKQRGCAEPGKSKFFTKEVVAKYAKIFNDSYHQGNYNDYF